MSTEEPPATSDADKPGTSDASSAAKPDKGPPPPGFIPTKFDGLRPGFVFKQRGEHGEGYYPRFAPAPEPEPAPAPVAAPKFVAAGAFDGARPGFVFKMGDQGLGYYFDAVGLESALEGLPSDQFKELRQNLAAVDVSDSSEPSLLDELTAAGGDVKVLAQMAKVDRTALTAKLKELGFKGLRTRQRLEAELKEWKPGLRR